MTSSLRDRVSPEDWNNPFGMFFDEITAAHAGVPSSPRGSGRGALVWPGLLRRLDRIDPSYRT
jgi:hypothetical protein